MSSLIRCGVLGFGYWGPNLVRNLSAHADIEVVALADPRPERLQIVGRRYPGLETTTDTESVVDDSRIDAIAVATPPTTHAPIALRALSLGKHVLLTKPIAMNGHDARAVADAAERADNVLLIDHTFVYTGAVRKLHELLGAGGLGQLYYYDSMRVNLGIHQPDASVIWDLAPHDLSILDHLVGEQPVEVMATTRRMFGPFDDMAQIDLAYDSGFGAHINLSWVSPVKIRLVILGGSERFAVYDDTHASEKVKVYDTSVEDLRARMHTEESRHRGLVEYRTGDVYLPKIDQTEALEVEVDHFVQCIQGRAVPVTGAASGVKTVLVLEAIERSIRAGERAKVEML